MIFTVLWKPDSQQQLAQLWLNGPDRNTIAAAADRTMPGSNRILNCRENLDLEI
jgi:hypothetical protein